MNHVEIPNDLPRLTIRASDSHKGTFGTALLVGGSRGMAGAIALSGMAALRSGAGKVRVAVPDVCLETVAHFEPSYMTVPLECDDHGCLQGNSLEAIRDLARSATCMGIGPGLTCTDETTRLMSWLYRTVPQPMVVDADGLNALAAVPDALAQPGGPRVLTPHPGEFTRLCQAFQMPVDAATDVQRRVAHELAARCGVVVVLKGQQSLVTDGQSQFLNSTGNPGMATGGSGDVLTGVITALICQKLEPLAAARLGVFAHGLAGDKAAAEIGMVGLTARDLLHYLPYAWRTLA